MSDDYTHGDNMLDPDAVMANEIERLTAEREHYKGKAEVWEDAARSLQARVKALLQEVSDE